MGWFQALMGNGDSVAKPVDAIGTAIDKIFTSDEERLTKAESMERLKQILPELTAALDQLNAKSSFLFVQLARPVCVYISGINFFHLGIAVVWFGKVNIPEWYIEASTYGFLGALGLYGLARTVEKLGGKTK